MAKPNYQFEKRQRDLAKKAKQEEKRRQKLANKAASEGAGGGDPTSTIETTPDEDAQAPRPDGDAAT